MELINKNKINEYDDLGYLRFESLIDQSVLEELRGECELIVQKEKENKKGSLSFVGDDLYVFTNVHQFPEYNFDKIYEKTPLVQIAEELLGGEVMLLNSQYFIKPPGMPGVQAHQDDYYFCSKNHASVNFWVPLEDADENNGCLYYYDSSHKKGLLPHHSPYKAGASMIQDLSEFEKQEKRSMPAKAGDFLMHSGLNIHGAFDNTSNTTRRAMTRYYCLKDKGIDQARKNLLLKQKFMDLASSKN